MKYSLSIHIVTNNQSIIDAFMIKSPAKLDNKVWAEEHTIVEGIDIDGNKYISALINFNQDADRTVIWEWMKNKKDQVLGDLLDGSHMELIKCYHDQTPRKSCEITWEWHK